MNGSTVRAKKGFSSGLKKLRKRKHLTQNSFAETFRDSEGKSISLDTVKNWEQGRTFPDIGLILDICDFFDCDLDCLFDRIDDSTHDMKFIHDQTGLNEETVRALSQLKEQSDDAIMVVLSHLIKDKKMLDALVGYYSSAFKEIAEKEPYNRIACDPKLTDERLYFANCFGQVEADKDRFFEKYRHDPDITEQMVFELKKRSLDKQTRQLEGYEQLLFDCKGDQSRNKDEQLMIIAKFLQYLGESDFMRRADCGLDEYYGIGENDKHGYVSSVVDFSDIEDCDLPVEESKLFL